MDLPDNNRAQKVQAALYRISESAHAAQNLESLYQLIHSIIAELMPASNFYIALYDKTADLLSFPYYADEYDTTPEPQKPGRGLTEYVLRSGQPLLATPEIYDQLLAQGEVERIGADALDWLGVPLKTPSKIIGMMAVQTYTPKIRYSAADQELLSFISTQVAMAIERKRVEADLRVSEDRYRLLFENAPVGILLANSQGQIVEVNPNTLQILGSPSVEATKAINILTYPPLIEMGFSADARRSIETGKPVVAERPYVSKWGRSAYLLYHVIPILDENGCVTLLQVMIEDITERKRSDGKIRNLNRMLQVISQANEALVRELDENELMQRVCQILVDVGEYRLAWIGMARKNEDKTIYPVASAGLDEGYSETAEVTWAATESGRGPVGTAIRTGQAVLVQDIQADPLCTPWRQAALERGFASSISLPLLSRGEAFGTVNVYACEAEAFDDEEVKLLHEMANDLAYGVMALREAAIRRQMEAVLRENEEKYRNVVERANDGITIIQNEVVVFANQHLVELWGGSLNEVIGTSFLNYINTGDTPNLADYYQKRISGDRLPSTYTAKLLRKDGSRVDVEINAGVFTYQGHPADLVIVRDISERKQAEQDRARRLLELEAVNQLSTALRSAQNLNEMLPVLLAETLTMMNTRAGAIYLYETASGELRLKAAQDWFTQLSLPIQPGDGIGGLVFSSGDIIYSDDYASDPRTRQVVRGLVPAGWSGVCVPLKTATDTIGIFYVAVQQPRELQPDEVRLLTILTEIAGNAIHRMQLHAQTEQNVQRLNALRTIDITITASLDLRVTLDVLLEQVISQLGAHATDVLLLYEHTQTLEYIVGRGFHRSSNPRSRLRLGEDYPGRVALERRTITVSAPDKVMNEPLHPYLSTEEDFKTYYGVPLIAKGKVKGVLELFFRTSFSPDPEWLDFLETLAGQTAIAIDDAQLFEYLQRMNTELIVAYDTTIEGWSRALELRDRVTEGHTQRVADMTLTLARSMQVFIEENLVHIRRGALLHDIGKMGVPDEILMKPGPLTDDEWDIMRKHTEYASDLLRSIDYLRPALDIPFYHHERWDGKGYPRRLQGEQIPLEARIFAVVDVWDALTSDRPYSKAWEPQVAKEYILSQSGAQFDPQVVAAFIKLLEAGAFNAEY